MWDAIEDSPAAAGTVRLRSELMIAVRHIVEGWEVTQAEAAGRLGLTQPCLNDQLRGRVARFSLDALVEITGRAGLAIRLDVRDAA